MSPRLQPRRGQRHQPATPCSRRHFTSWSPRSRRYVAVLLQGAEYPDNCGESGGSRGATGKTTYASPVSNLSGRAFHETHAAWLEGSVGSEDVAETEQHKREDRDDTVVVEVTAEVESPIALVPQHLHVGATDNIPVPTVVIYLSWTLRRKCARDKSLCSQEDKAVTSGRKESTTSREA